MLGGVGVAGADVARLELLELLLGAEFVGLWGGGVVLRRERDGVEMRLRKGWKGRGGGRNVPLFGVWRWGKA